MYLKYHIMYVLEILYVLWEFFETFMNFQNKLCILVVWSLVVKGLIYKRMLQDESILVQVIQSIRKFPSNFITMVEIKLK